MYRPAALTVLVLFALSAGPQIVRGEGAESSARGDDFEVNIDSRWTGCEYGGYMPVRLRIVNHGPPRPLRLVLESNDYNQELSIERMVNAPQNAVVRTTLSVPMVGNTSYATLRAYGPKGEIESMRQTVVLPRASGLQQFAPALLVVSSSPIDFLAWRESMFRHVSTGGSHSPYGHYSPFSSVSDINNQEISSASSLPDNWIDYAGLDIVAISLDDFTKISNEQRAALRKWVHSGGTLFLTAIGPWDDSRGDVDRLLETGTLANVSPEWTPAEVGTRELIQSSLRPIDKIEQEHQASTGRYPGPTAAVETAENSEATADQTPQFMWATDSGVFRSRRLMLGTVYAFQDNPFPGSDADWSWWRNHYPDENLWLQRQGFTSRSANSEYLDFLIPGIQRFPVGAFLVLITIFSVIIGPVNYLYFLKRKQLALIVVTIPVVAFLTSASLFSYSALSHGFSVKSRMRSMTLVDQGAQSAITFSRNSLYAGFAPSEGLTFRPDTAVFPLWNASRTFESGRVDLTNGQHFVSGWFPSRTRTQFYTTTYEDQRSRIDVDPPQNDTLVVKNGFPYGFKALGVYATDGKYYVGYDIPAGGSAELVPATTENTQHYIELAGENKPALPPEVVEQTNYYNPYSFTGRMYGYGYNSVNTSFAKSEIHRLWDQVKRFSETPNPQTVNDGQPFYAGIAAENPGVDLGIEGTNEFAPAHLVIGFYK